MRAKVVGSTVQIDDDGDEQEKNVDGWLIGQGEYIR